MKISVVIPVYNGKGIIDDAIIALQRQTIKPHKIICVDDASTDNSAEYIKSKFPFVKVLKNEKNLGASGTYTRGIKCAKDKGYDLVWLIDQDSIPFSDALEQLLVYYEKQPSAVYISTLIEKSSNMVIPMLSRNKIDYNKPYVADLCNFSGMMIPMDVIECVGYPLDEMGMDAADWEYCLRIRKNGYPTYVIPNSRIYHTPGTPVRVKLPFKYSYAIFDGQKYRSAVSRNVTIRLDSENRYHSIARNVVILGKMNYTDLFLKRFIIKLLFKHIIKIIIYEKNRKIGKLKAFINGILEGLLTTPPEH